MIPFCFAHYKRKSEMSPVGTAPMFKTHHVETVPTSKRYSI